jgi:hypothetical protein
VTALNAAPHVALEDVEWRVDGQPKVEEGRTPICRFVPYLDAVIIAKLLDQWVGAGNWSDTYETGTVAGKEAMWCRLSIRVDDEWVTKTDIGVASTFEAQKGSVSDAFKRAACLKWGVGRNVYDLPTLWAVCRTFTSQGKTQAVADGKKTLDDLMRKLKALGFDDPKGKVREDEPVDEPKNEPPPGVDRETGEVTKSQPSDGGSGKPPSDGASPLERINALGLKGKKVGELRDQLKAQGVPWPPANLDKDQQTAFDDVLAAWTEGKAA